jgi:hypothetical protein
MKSSYIVLKPRTVSCVKLLIFIIYFILNLHVLSAIMNPSNGTRRNLGGKESALVLRVHNFY